MHSTPCAEEFFAEPGITSGTGTDRFFSFEIAGRGHCDLLLSRFVVLQFRKDIGIVQLALPGAAAKQNHPPLSVCRITLGVRARNQSGVRTRRNRLPMTFEKWPIHHWEATFESLEGQGTTPICECHPGIDVSKWRTERGSRYRTIGC